MPAPATVGARYRVEMSVENRTHNDHWMGGIHTELRLPRRRRGQRDSTSQDIVTAVRQLVSIANDELIAGILNRNKLTTGRGNRWTRERVTALRSHHKIPVYCPAEQGQEPWLNLSKA